MKIKLLFLLALAFIAIYPVQAQTVGHHPQWNPERTWVFMAGLVEWNDPEMFSSFPQEGRQDDVLHQVLKERGVPANQMVYLRDRQATTERIKTELQRMLAKTREGDLIFVYFEGHGYKDESGKNTFLASYDAGDDVDGVAVPWIPDAIERGFRGSRAVIALDNCYSGAMAQAVQTGRRRVSYAVLASSLASQASTGNWTFTEALVSGFRGAPYVDDDGDGQVTFAEMGENAQQDMLFGEEQIATIAFTGEFDPHTVLGESTGPAAARVGERVEAYSERDWYKGYIIDARGNRFLIHYYGYDETEDEWVAGNLIRQPKVIKYAVGESVEVEWKKQWYQARVIRIKGGSHYISYVGYGQEWNEWVPSKRIRRPQHALTYGSGANAEALSATRS